jgi:peptidoglycan hydrolase-like protein with peptidoglycan-binding domain
MTTAASAQRIGSGATTDPWHLDARLDSVPALVAVRADAHPAFDRIVFELDGELPGYDVRYVPRILHPGTGDLVPLHGREFLAVAVIPACAFTHEGPLGFPPGPTTTGLAAVRALLGVADGRGVVTYGIGVAARTPYLVRQAVGPSRVVIDVAHLPPGTGEHLLCPGSRGAGVATWQWRLNLALHLHLAVDEDFGSITAAATREFQRDRHLTADGVVGSRSRAAMERLLGV